MASCRRVTPPQRRDVIRLNFKMCKKRHMVLMELREIMTPVSVLCLLRTTCFLFFLFCIRPGLLLYYGFCPPLQSLLRLDLLKD